MNWPKAIFLALGAVGAGITLMLQAITNVYANDQPYLAVKAFPLNGFALEFLASKQMATTDLQVQSIDSAARSLESIASLSHRKEPLTPRALSIMALARVDKASQANILLATNQLSRRPLILQGHLLQYYAEKEDVTGGVTILNNMLSVHPEHRELLYPALVQALQDEQSIEPIARVLANEPSWGSGFLLAAASNDDSAKNLASLRLLLMDKILITPEVDKVIISGVVSGGEIEAANGLYQRVSAQNNSGSSVQSSGVTSDRLEPRPLDWREAFPPFDWRVNDDPDARSQIVPEPERLQFRILRGKAGIIAERMLAAPKSGFTLKIAHDISPADQVEDVRVMVQCVNAEISVIDQPLSTAPSQFEITSLPTGCTMMNIVIRGRAWSDKSDLHGEITSVTLLPNS